MMSVAGNQKSTKPTLLLSIAVLIVTILIGFSINPQKESKLPELLRPVAVVPSKDITHVDLVDHNNTPVDLARLKNKWTFVFFGFTHCPDVCPATLMQLRVLKKTLEKEKMNNGNTQFFFVSVDPDRDSLEHLAGYIKYFDPEFVAATGSNKAIADLERQVGAYHRFEKKRTDGNYNVAHSADVFLINSSAQLVAKFRPPMDTDKIAKQLAVFISMRQTLG